VDIWGHLQLHCQLPGGELRQKWTGLILGKRPSMHTIVCSLKWIIFLTGHQSAEGNWVYLCSLREPRWLCGMSIRLSIAHLKQPALFNDTDFIGQLYMIIVGECCCYHYFVDIVVMWFLCCWCCYCLSLQYTWSGSRLWRKNRRKGLLCDGVDLNRNYNSMWGGVSHSAKLTVTSVP